jgi:aspartate beta-hydroxylase
MLEAAERAQAQGQPEEAARLLSAARSLAPENAAVLAACGLQALRKGDAAEAKQWLGKSLALNSSDPRVHLNLATSLRSLNDADNEMKALDQALTLDPYFFPAVMQKASLLERQGKGREAARTYGRALSSLRSGDQIPANWQPLIEHAQRTALADLRELEEWLNSRMKDVRERHADASQDRVDHCLGAILGKRRVYVQQPTHTHFPRLPAIEFYDRKDFPWIRRVEEATDDIRGELLELLREARGDFVPYLNHATSEALNQWKELNQSRRWSALFLYKYGERIEQNIERCPKTVAALESAPVVKIPHRGPSSLFSLLEPKTRIPPHSGVTNTRLTVHIPLIVPPNCGFRVGSQVREWQPGTALIFDDTIEHEAWNNSDEPRVVLIFDIWNPLLTQAEQDLMATATEAIAEFYGD